MKNIANIGLGLIVVAILVVLFPPITNLMDPESVTQGKNDVTQIATAVIAYETEYGHPPATNENFRLVDGEFLAALMGTNASGLNPQNIMFIEVGNAKKGKSGLRDGAFVDSWGVPYQIVFDGNADMQVNAGTNRILVRKKVAVWSNPDGQPGTDEKKRRRSYVTSWD